MFIIDNFSIEGFWGKYRIETSLNKSITSFVGKNGSGKTTLIKILNSILNVDIKSIYELPFRSAKIKLKDGRKSRTISVYFEDDKFGLNILKYEIGKLHYKIPFVERDVFERSRIHPRIARQVHELRQLIEELTTISWVSIYRESSSTIDNEFQSKRYSDSALSPIDVRLKSLLNDLARFQLKLSENANAILNQFQKDVLLSIIYDEDFDTFDLLNLPNLELSKERKGLMDAFKELGILDDDSKTKINNHIRKLATGIRTLREVGQKAEKGETYTLTTDDVIPVPLFKRTQHIIKKSTEVIDNKNLIFEPIERFFSILNSFISDKLFFLDSAGNLVIVKEDHNVNINDMSSGEKHILVFLIDTLLQQEKPVIFMADEPELSLHIEWQSKLLSSIYKLNKNSQLIVATHSPEIVGNHPESIIAMEDIINECA